MVQGWHVAEMILTVQLAEKSRLADQTMAAPRYPDSCAKLLTNAGTHGNGHSIRPGPPWGIRS